MLSISHHLIFFLNKKINKMKQLVFLVLLAMSTTAIFGQTNGQSKQKKQHSTAVNAKYTCPTHPEVISSKPGNCAKCGTKLTVQRQGSKQAQSTTYSCPMHPGVVSNTTGKCAECGKELEKQKSSEEQ
jgi:DNA-directed RNA polymerase subunit RPC12/RpoP